MKPSAIRTIIVIAALLLILAAIAGLFSFTGADGTSSTDQISHTTSTPDTKSHPVVYRHLSEKINNLNQEINILEIDLRAPGVEIFPVLSHDLVYGFETLSSISSRVGAYAAVNAGFFSQYGVPSGMVYTGGRLFTASDNQYPVFMIQDGKASLSAIKSEMYVTDGSKQMKADKLNTPGQSGETVVYTRDYGTSNRAAIQNTTFIVTNGSIHDISVKKGETPIPKDGFLVTIYGSGITKLPFEKGQKVMFTHSPDLSPVTSAYQCGSWIVRNGNVVIPEKDPWIGVTTNRDPRTVVGLKDDHSVVLLTVDGRQPGYSAGLTGTELGELLINLGVSDAAMLDGGASTEMIVNGSIVNKPSFNGKERPLGGGIIVRIAK